MSGRHARRAKKRKDTPGFSAALRKHLSTCPKCGKPGPHFVPPSFGDAGFYTCEADKPGFTIPRSRPEAP